MVSHRKGWGGRGFGHCFHPVVDVSVLEPKGLVFDGVFERLHEAQELLVGHRGLLELQSNHLLVFVVPSADVFVSTGLLNQAQNVGLLFAQNKLDDRRVTGDAETGLDGTLAERVEERLVGHTKQLLLVNRSAEVEGHNAVLRHSVSESKFGLGLDVLTGLNHILVLGSEEHADVARGEFERVGGRNPVQHGRLARASLLGDVLDFVGIVISENGKHGHGG